MNGFVFDAQTGQPLVAVNIYESNQTGAPISTRGTTTDVDGRFFAGDLTAPNIAFRYVGYKTLVIPNRSGFVKIEMLPETQQLPPVTVKPAPEKRGWLVALLVALGLYQITK